MVALAKNDFAVRLSHALSAINYPPERGRRARLAKEMSVSGEAARKWLSGESVPGINNARKMATLLGINVDWLLTGRGDMHPEDAAADAMAALNPRHRALIGLFDALTEDQQAQVIRDLEKKKHLNDELLEQLLARGKNRAAG